MLLHCRYICEMLPRCLLRIVRFLGVSASFSLIVEFQSLELQLFNYCTNILTLQLKFPQFHPSGTFSAIVITIIHLRSNNCVQSPGSIGFASNFQYISKRTSLVPRPFLKAMLTTVITVISDHHRDAKLLEICRAHINFNKTLFGLSLTPVHLSCSVQPTVR